MDVKLNLTFGLITAIISIAIIEFGAGSISEIVVPSNTKSQKWSQYQRLGTANPKVHGVIPCKIFKWTVYRDFRDRD